MRHGFACLWSALLALAVGCTSTTLDPRTEVLLQIEAERLVKVTADHLTVEISSGPSGGTLTADDPEEFDLTSDDFNWPASLALVAKPGHEDHVFDITINIEVKGKRVARSRVKSNFIKHQTLLLKTLLYSDCIGKLDCSGSETCVAPDGNARCDSADVDPLTLPTLKVGDAAGTGQTAANGGDSAARAGQGGAAANGGAQGGRAGSQSGGVAGKSNPMDAGTSPSDSGTGSCTMTGPEQCDNGLDDDCNGQMDCADPACNARMQCVPSGSLLGVLVPAGSNCPSGFDKEEQLLHQGLNDPGCGGCSCQPQPTTCAPQVYFYNTTTQCAGDTAPFRNGTLVMAGIPQQPDCSAGPIGTSIGITTPAGWRVSMTQSTDSCRASGAPTPLPPTWSTTMKLCVRPASSNGCEAGYACVPKVDNAQVCTQRAATSCPAATSLQTWQRDFLDERSCGGCSCAAHGGSCSAIAVKLMRGSAMTTGAGGIGGTGGGGTGGGGTGGGGAGGIGGAAGSLALDGGTTPIGGTGGTVSPDAGTPSCGTIDSTLHDGEKACLLTTYAPSAYSEGAPTDPTCSAASVVTGSLKPSGPLELCCVN